ncbi:MAG: amino acid adenylation domain-containing protein [Bryobacterales bacterium]|nr:amino acid adenylation domain-containing protein [Bryobacterales bacterium]MBV9400105.1 amino acid adenylation domain-containing protein [Bryobacterales bacterium]
MNGCGDFSFPLTTVQRGLWFSQKVRPSAMMNIAEAVEIYGEIKPQIFQEALRQVAAEAEQLRVRVVEQDGKPRQILRPVYEGDFPYIDMSRQADPGAAVEAWMSDELRRPVDLAHDPLWVSALLKAADGRYFWYHRAHHIVCDGYGGGLIARRLGDIYSAYVQGREPQRNQFTTVAAVVEAEAGYRASRRFDRDRQYWRDQLAQMPEAVTLARPRRRHNLSGNVLRSTGQLSADTAGRLAELAKGAGISVPQILISLIAAYYHRASTANELVFAMPVSGRFGVLRDAVSVCANIAPIRLRLTNEMTAPELFAEVSRLAGQALRHQQYRYEDLRRDLGLVGHDQNIAWLGINIEPFDYRLNFAGARTILHNLSNSSIDDLVAFVLGHGTEAGLRIVLDANPSLYNPAELDEHLRRLMRLIEQVLGDPETPLGEIDILGGEERHRLVTLWNNTSSEVENASLPAIVGEWAARTPDAPAIVFENTAFSYRELHDRSVCQAHKLIASGVKPGDIVAVALPRSEQLLVVLLAIMRTGAAYLPLDLDGPMERTALVLQDASPAVLIAEPEMHTYFAREGLTVLEPEHPGLPVSDNIDRSTPEGIVYLLYTSGSTGRPKGVEISHRNLSNFLQGMQRQLRPSATDRYVALTNLIFDIAGLELYLPLTVGACVVMAGSGATRNPAALAQQIRQSRATHIQATPSMWRILLVSPETKLDDVHALVGGEVLTAELAARLKRMAARVTQFYGPTETTIWSTAFELGDIGADPPPIGRPILNTQVYVLDENRRPVPTGATGELYIGGAGVARGYLNQPKLTAERFLANPFAEGRMYRTGDLVRWTDDGLLEFIGRADNQVKVNGHRVELGEIESLLLRHENVAEAAVVAHSNGDAAVSLAAYLVARTGTAIDIDSVRGSLARRLPGSVMPASFTVLDAMPLTPNAKLDRKALPIPERASRNTHAEPATAVEKKLAALWRQILKTDRVGLHDDFFELGGDSLKAAELAACFPEWFEMELPLGSLFEAPTVSVLAALIERSGGEFKDPLGVVLPLRKAGTQRPLFCIHPVTGISMGFAGLLRHLDPEIPVYGLQSRGLCDGATLPGSIEEIAEDYLAEIRWIQPEGPYRLFGRSMGGLIGHAIAGAMQSHGLDVELLAMVDTYLFASGRRLRTEPDEVIAALRFLNIYLTRENTPQTLLELNRFLLQPETAAAIPHAQGIVKLAGEIGINRLSGVMHNNLQLAREYAPGRVDVNLLYFHATEMTGDLDGIIDRSPSAWRPFVGGIETHELACHHEAVMDPVPAREIAGRLQQRLFGMEQEAVAS